MTFPPLGKNGFKKEGVTRREREGLPSFIKAFVDPMPKIACGASEPTQAAGSRTDIARVKEEY